MLKRVSLLLSFVMLFSLIGNPGFFPNRVQAAASLKSTPTSSTKFTPGIVLIGLKSEMVSSQSRNQSQSIDHLEAIVSQYHVQKLDRVFPNQHSSLAVKTNLADQTSPQDLSQIYRLHVPPQTDIPAAIKQLQADPTVAFAEPDYLAQEVTTTPNDSNYSDQWGLTKIQADQAWDITQGSSDVTVAVVDAGIDAGHEDLASQLWNNPGEIPGNGIDDDNDGFVDDIHGANILGNNVDLTDATGHGTQVAGVIAAETNNAKGIAGVCWQCKLMIVKVMSSGGTANYSDIAAGVAYAAQKGVKVINLSLGGYNDSATLRAAVALASQTAVVVGGAGNDNSSSPFYPAAYTQYALAVAGTTLADTKKDDSNYGGWISISAPGDQIYTTYDGGSYGPAAGTSMAAPFVSGLAGLIISQHPDWNPAQIRAQIIQTTDNIDSLNPGFEGKLGNGRINASKAISTTPSPLISNLGYQVNGQASGVLKVGLTNTLTVTFRDDWKDVGALSATLSTNSTDVTIAKSTTFIGPITAGQAVTNSNDAFQISVPAGKYGIPIPLTLVTNADGVVANHSFTISTESVEVPVSGTISTDTTWDNSRVYHATGNITIANGATLTIGPGTVVKFDKGKGLVVHGKLVADGTATKMIRFTSASTNPFPGDWSTSYNSINSSIFFPNDSTPATYDVDGNYLSGTILRYTVIEYGGGIALQGGSPFIDHNILTNNSGNVITYNGVNGGSPIIRNNQIVNNGGGLTSIDLGAPTGQNYVTLQGNLLSGNKGWIQINGPHQFLQNTLTGQRSYLTGGFSYGPGDPAMLISGSGGLFHGNTFWFNKTAIIVQAATTSGQTTDMSQNYWGTTDPALIQSSVWDSNDYPDVGSINVYPVLPTPDPHAPAVAYGGALTPPSPVGIQSVHFAMNFSRPVDQSTEPNLSFHIAKRGTIEKFGNIAPLGSNIRSDRFGRVWLACGSNQTVCNNWGIKQYDGKNWTSFSTSNSGLVSNFVSAIYVAVNGDVWVGYFNGQVSLLRGATWTTFSNQDTGFNTFDAVSAMTEDENGTVYIINYVTKAAWFNGYSWEHKDINEILPSGGPSLGFGRDPQGRIWFSNSTGVANFDGNHWTVYTPGKGLPGDFIPYYRLYGDSKGRIWVAAGSNPNVDPSQAKSVYMFDGNTWVGYGPKDTNNMLDPTSLVDGFWEDRDGSLLVKMGTRVVQTDGTRWWYSPIISEVSPLSPSSYLFDTQFNLWIRDKDNGLDVRWGGVDYPLPVGKWVSDTQYETDYDFTSLILRGDYNLAVSGLTDTTGMPVSEEIGIKFTLDYAGQISDLTPPTTPSIYATGKSGDPSYIQASWNGSFGLIYRYAIGSSSGTMDIVNWTLVSEPQVTRSGLGLIEGRKYWVSVQARNAGGLWSPIGVSTFISGQPTQRTLYLPLTRR